MADNTRETFLLNFKKRKPEQKQLINQWISTQDNATASIISLIQHAIDRFGLVDVLDHEVSKQLFAETLMINNINVVSQEVTAGTNIQTNDKCVIKTEINQVKDKLKKDSPINVAEKEDDKLFITSDIDTNSF